MIRPLITTLALAIAATCYVAAPVLAQNQEPVPDTHGDTLNCKDELAKYTAELPNVADRTKHAAAMKQIKLARESLGKQDEKMCMSHVSKAIKLMK